MAKIGLAMVAANVAAREASRLTSDGGTCNLDWLSVRLPRKSRAFEAECESAGLSVDWYRWARAYCVRVEASGQAAARTAGVEAACRALRAAGMDAHVRYVMD